MKTSNLLVTTALAALLAVPGLAQDTGTGTTGTEATQGSDLDTYLVGDLIGLPVEGSDGAEAGRVENVVGGDTAPQLLVATEERTIALPLDQVTLTETGTALRIDRTAADLEQMAAYEDGGEMTLDPGMMVSDAMVGTGTEMAGGAGETTATGTDTTDLAAGGDGTDAAGTGTDTGSADMAEGVGSGTLTPGAGTGTDTTDMAGTETTGMETTGTEGDLAGTLAPEAREGLAGGAPEMPLGDAEMAEGTGGTMTPDAGTDESTAMAETDRTMQSDDAGSDMAGTDTSGTAAMDTPGAEAGSAFTGLTVNQLIAMTVVGADGEVVGDIDYLYRDSAGAYMAVMGIGGFLGIGEHTVSIPLGDFTVDAQQNLLILDQTEEQLEAMPEMEVEDGIEELSEDHVIEA